MVVLHHHGEESHAGNTYRVGSVMYKVTYTCYNPVCPCEGTTHDLNVVIEPDTGAKYVWDEESKHCPECGSELEEM